MIELNRHIEILLLNNDCVIVPGLGGFMAHHVVARYDESDKLFLPPLRTLGFNPQLKINDHLLVQSYIESYDISYPEALRRIENEVKELKQHLENEGEYELTDLGSLKMNEEGNYEFHPYEAGILSPTLYGLSSFDMHMLSLLQRQTDNKDGNTDDNVPQTIESFEIIKTKEKANNGQSDNKANDTIIVRMSWVRNAVAMAASILLFFFISTPIDNSKISNQVQQSSILPLITQAEKAVDQTETTTLPIHVSITSEEKTTETDVNKSDTRTSVSSNGMSVSVYTIVLASQTPLRHAEEFIGRLTKNNIKGARTMNMQSSAKVRVVIGTFSTEEDAQRQLKEYRAINSIFNEAWVLHVKE